MKPAAVLRFRSGTPERIIAQALYEYGIVVGDKNSGGAPTDGAGGFPITMDKRWAIGDGVIPPLNFTGVRLTDFEVIAQ
jgi:hypothetical protein